LADDINNLSDPINEVSGTEHKCDAAARGSHNGNRYSEELLSMFIIFVWLAASLAVGGIASGRNRSFVGWALLSLLISPLLGVLFLIAAGTKPARIIEQAPKRDPLAAMTRPTFDPEPVTVMERIEDGRRAVRNSRWGFAVFLVVICLAIGAGYRLTRQQELAPPQAQDERQDVPTPASYIVVPEPDPAAQGELLYRWATASAQLVPQGD
jgi:hypothetical protein